MSDDSSGFGLRRLPGPLRSAGCCRRWRLVAAVTVPLVVSGDALAAAGAAGDAGASDLVFLAQIAALIFVGRLLGEVMQRIGQPAVVGELIGGLLLGPSVFGVVWPDAQQVLFPDSEAQRSMTNAVSQLGILLLLLLTGMEADLRLLRKVGRVSAIVSVCGICIPFAAGMALGHFIPDRMLANPGDRLITALFLGTALSISSVKIVATVLREMNFLRRDLGQVILSAAIIDDSVGWIIVAIVLGLATQGGVDPISVGRTILGTAIFIFVSLTVGRRLVFDAIRWANDVLVSEFPVISIVLLIMAAMALITQVIGVHTMLGAFVAGVLTGESPILTRRIARQIRALIIGLFAPVFFGVAGLTANLTLLQDKSLLMLTGALIAVAVVGKVTGAFVGGRLARLSARESLALAAGMNARGSTEVIVATIGLSMGVLTEAFFTSILVMALVTTMTMPSMLRWLLSRVPPSRDESERMRREEFDAKAFIPNLERILVAVDESATGKFAARLAGIVAGVRGQPATILHVGDRAKLQEKKKGDPDSPEAHLEAAAEGAAASVETDEGASDKDRGPKVHIISKAKELEADAAVASEARKGFDLLVVGVDSGGSEDAGLGDEMVSATAEFGGPLAIVVARGKHIGDPMGTLRILVPVTGTEVSRHAAEVAAALAHSVENPVTALHVSRESPTVKKRRAGASSQQHEHVILEDFLEMAGHYKATARTVVRVNEPPETAILNEAKKGGFDLIVIGVNRRPGKTLYFGDVAAKVIAESEISVLVVTGAATPSGTQDSGRDDDD